jgi:hypothetical protein
MYTFDAVERSEHGRSEDGRESWGARGSFQVGIQESEVRLVTRSVACCNDHSF